MTCSGFGDSWAPSTAPRYSALKAARPAAKASALDANWRKTYSHWVQTRYWLTSMATLEHEKVLVVRGQEGRELIPQTLERRGARVTVLPLYRRFCPDYDKATLNAMLNDFSPEAIVTLSGETLNNLIALSDNTGHNLENTLLVVPVERIAEQARLAGLRRTCIPGSLADSSIVAAVAEQLASLDGGSGNTK